MFDWNDNTVAELRRLRESGLTAGQIVVEMPGTTRSGVLGKLQRLGVPAPVRQRKAPKPRRLTSDEQAVARAAAAKRAKAEAARVRKLSEAPLPVAGLVRLLDQRDGCAFPMWSHNIDWQVKGALEKAMVCGRPKRPGGSRYCSPHHCLAYIPVSERVEGDRA